MQLVQKVRKEHLVQRDLLVIRVEMVPRETEVLLEQMDSKVQ